MVSLLQSAATVTSGPLDTAQGVSSLVRAKAQAAAAPAAVVPERKPPMEPPPWTPSKAVVGGTWNVSSNGATATLERRDLVTGELMVLATVSIAADQARRAAHSYAAESPGARFAAIA